MSLMFAKQFSGMIFTSQFDISFLLSFFKDRNQLSFLQKNVNCYNFPCWHSLLLMANWIKSLLEPIKYLVLEKQLSTSYLFWNTGTFRGPLFYKWGHFLQAQYHEAAKEFSTILWNILKYLLKVLWFLWYVSYISLNVCTFLLLTH